MISYYHIFHITVHIAGDKFKIEIWKTKTKIRTTGVRSAE